jgi:hypothetical protein
MPLSKLMRLGTMVGQSQDCDKSVFSDLTRGLLLRVSLPWSRLFSSFRASQNQQWSWKHVVTDQGSDWWTVPPGSTQPRDHEASLVSF